MAAVSVPPASASASEAIDDDQAIIVLGGGLGQTPAASAYGTAELSEQALRDEPSGRVENALRAVAGFQQFRRSDSRSANPSAQGVTLRALGGNASSRSLVLLDGIPQADPYFGYVPFSAFDAQALGGARVTRGGGLGAFGVGAVAGTIELFSPDRSQLPPAQASGLVGSRDAQELTASVSPDVGAGFITLGGRWERGDGFYTTPEALRTPATVPARYRDGTVSLRGVAPVGADSEIQARLGLFRDNRTLRFQGADSSSEGQDASLRFLSHGRWQVDALAYVQMRDFSNVTVSATSLRPVLNQYATPALGLGGKIEVRPPTGPGNVLRIGSDVRLASGDMRENALAASGAVSARRQGNGQQVTAGVYAENDLTVGNLALTGGVRLDRWTITGGRFLEANGVGTVTTNTRYPDRDGWEMNVRGGPHWQVLPYLALRAAGYTGFRLPTLNELYRSFTVFPVTTRANAALVPERLKGGEAGIDLTPAKGARLTATFFYNRLDDAIANVTIGTNLRERRNVDAIVAKGIEFSGEWAVGAFRLSASYAYSDSRLHASGASVALDGLRPAQTPTHSANMQIGWEKAAGPAVTAILRYAGPQYEDDLSIDRMPHALTVDGAIRLPISRQVELIARIENIFDVAVITRKVGSDIDLGTPRTAWFGLRLTGKP